MRRRTMDIAKTGDGVNLKKKKRQNPFHESCKNIVVKDDFIYVNKRKQKRHPQVTFNTRSQSNCICCTNKSH